MNARPNILWLCTDQQRHDTLGVYGNAAIRTPNIDRLASEGTTFANAYCQSPICTPSRAGFLTGCYPSTVHVNRNGNDEFPAEAAEKLVTHQLAKSGYDCGLAGKLHLSAAYGRVERRPDDGYRTFKWSHHPKPEDFWPTEQHDYQQWLQDKNVDWDEAYNTTVDGWMDGERFRPGIAAEHHQTTWCFEETINFIREQRPDGPEQSWLMNVNPFAPHPPLDPPPEYLRRIEERLDQIEPPRFQPSEMKTQLAFQGIDFQTTDPIDPATYDWRRTIAAYYAMIEQIDDQVGRVLAVLEETGQRENTLVIFMSDHGETLGDHGLFWKGCRFYESLVHVPLIVSWPGQVQAGLRSSALVELTDIAPTLYDVAGLETPDWVQGESLWPLLSGAADPALHRDFVRCEFHDALNQPHASHGNMLFDGRHKLCVYHGHSIGELYDLHDDPNEFRNLWNEPDQQPLKFDLMKRLFDDTQLTMDIGAERTARF